MAEINFKLKYLLHNIELLLKSLTAAKHFYVFREFKLENLAFVMGFFLLSTVAKAEGAQTLTRQQCQKIYNVELLKTKPRAQKFLNTSNSAKHRSKWIQTHIQGLQLLTAQKVAIVDKLLSTYWNLLRQVDADFQLVIIPASAKVTDHPRFAHLKGVALKQSFQENIQHMSEYEIKSPYTWDQTSAVTAYPVCVIKADSIHDSIYDFQPLAHELGHVFEQALIPISKVLANRILFSLANDHPERFLSIYSAINANEYFAESIAAYARSTSNYEETYDKSRMLLTRDQLKKKDPEMFSFIQELLLMNDGPN